MLGIPHFELFVHANAGTEITGTESIALKGFYAFIIDR